MTVLQLIVASVPAGFETAEMLGTITETLALLARVVADVVMVDEVLGDVVFAF
jgi:hypothetical protein